MVRALNRWASGTPSGTSPRTPQVLATVLLAAFAANATALPEARGDVTRLELNRRLEREIAGGEIDHFEVSLAPGQYAHVVVFQRGIDVSVSVEGGDKTVIDVDSPNNGIGAEEVSLLASEHRRYGLAVRPLRAAAPGGHYDITLTVLRPARPDDQLRMSAQEAYIEGVRLTEEQSAESLRRAIQKFEKVRSLSQSAGHGRQEAFALTYIGEDYLLLGEWRKALEYCYLGLRAMRLAGERGEEAYLLVNIGVLLGYLGEYERALRYHGEALTLGREGHDEGTEASALGNSGYVYYAVGDYHRALDHFRRALQLQRHSGHRGGEAEELRHIGMALYASGSYGKALDYYNDALPIQRTVRNRRGEGMTLNAMGEAYEALGDKERALEYFNQALFVRRASGLRADEADTLRRIGGVYAGFGEGQKALDYFRLSVAIQREVGDRVGEGLTLYEIARVEGVRGSLLEAREHAEAALAILESLLVRGGQQFRVPYLGVVSRAYGLYVDLLMRLQRRDPSESLNALALKASEDARARGLLELLSEGRAEVREGVDRDLLDRKRSLRELLSAKSEGQVRLSSRKHTEEEAAAAAKELEELKHQYEQVSAEIRAKSPRYAALTQPQALSLEEIQKQVLDERSLLLEYALGEDRSYLFAVERESIKVYELPNRPEVEGAARKVYDLLTARNRRVKFESAEDRRGRVARAEAEYAGAAVALSQMVLAPVAGDLGTKRLLVVADGALQYVPFSALPSPSNTTGYVPLAVEHEIVSLPSASVLAVLRQEIAGRAPPPKTLSVLADPVFEKDDERVKGTGREGVEVVAKAKRPAESPLVRSAQELGLGEGEELRIPRLPFTRREARAILALVPPGKRKEALDFEANRAAATSEKLGQYRLVHFATHGFLNSIHPELSGLVLSLVDREGKDQDGFLPVLEVYNLKLPVDLVVLSGCRTGLGKEIRGEGLVGLTRGFMYAGAARVLVSLWDVDDEATSELMVRFYEGMLGKKRLSPAAALRAAQVSIWKEKRWQSPYYWAAFVLQGEPK